MDNGRDRVPHEEVEGSWEPEPEPEEDTKEDGVLIMDTEIGRDL